MSTQPITHLPLGNLSVPSLCTGTWSWGDRTWGYNAAVDLPRVREAWAACMKGGMMFFDTAEVYGLGESERIIGGLLGGMGVEERKGVVVATKWLPVPKPWHFSLFAQTGAVQSLRDSLKRLGLEQVDLYQIHGNVGYHSLESMGKALAECQKLGLTKQVGISNFDTEQTIKMYEILKKHGVQLASNQVEFSLLRTLPESSGLLAAMKERNIACLAYSPLGQGRLSGKYSPTNPVPSGRKFSNIPIAELTPLLDEMRAIAGRYDVPVSAVALNWVMEKGAIPLGGARDGGQAEQNAKAMTFRMTKEELDKLQALSFTGKTSYWQKG